MVRNRPGVVARVEPSALSYEGLIHLVTVDFTDFDGTREETLIWEREPDARVIHGTGLPGIEEAGPMQRAEFLALQRAVRWQAIHPFLDPDGDGPLARLPFASPLHAAIEVEDFQMVPLLKAMRMPRVSLLLADDVGLGKTVEAGLILSELILQRRIQRVLILTPASLRHQWQQEMKEKFSLAFEVIDRPQTHQLRKRLGLGANPWRASPHAIASYHYLKQPDVLEDFLATCRVPEGSPHLPWDLLIVDEAHNLAPSAFGESSDLSRMLRQISPYFEHKVFATATPHNGRTRCFSGLLEMLDPSRFSQTSAFTPAERARVHEVVVRRLKSDINQVTRPPRFTERHLESVGLRLSPLEVSLGEAFSNFRAALLGCLGRAPRGDRTAGFFAVEVLGKRRLSSLHAFANSWSRLLEGAAAEAEVPASDVRASERAVREEAADDTELESRTGYAAEVIGTWLRPFADALSAEIAAVTATLADLGLAEYGPAVEPVADTRFDALRRVIDNRLRTHREGRAEWAAEERMVVFTEYKTTLDTLVARLRKHYPDDGAILQLYGSGEMDDHEREAVKRAFNDPASAARILVATDAASEGLNLQRTARYLHHFDIPWSPSRLEQRNGRIDRYGQSRDVTVSHFVSDDDADLAFLAFVVGKVHQIRHDLGATGEVIDAAVQRRFIHAAQEADLRVQLDRDLQRLSGQSIPDQDARARTSELDLHGRALGEQIAALRHALDHSGDHLRQTCAAALAQAVPPADFLPDGRPGFWRISQPIPSSWQDVVDEHLRIQGASERVVGALPAVAFDPTACIVEVAGRRLFQPPPDAALVHLRHPFVQQALQGHARRRFPGRTASASRWSVTVDPALPAGDDAWLILSVEELAVNELRETFHHWVRTIILPVRAGQLGDPLPVSSGEASLASASASPGAVAAARELWASVELELRDWLQAHAAQLSGELRTALEAELREALEREEQRFRSRQGELSALITTTRMEALERQLEEMRQEEGSLLFDPDGYAERLRVSAEDKQAELERIRRHTDSLREQLTRERERTISLLLPRRCTLRGEAQCLPVTVELRLREVRS